MQKVALPFHLVQLQMTNSPDIITSPLLDKEVFWVNVPASMMAGKFANSFQEKVLNEGDYSYLLDYQLTGDFEKRKITLHFEASKHQIAFRNLEVDFDYFVQVHEKGYWAIIPTLGIETFTLEEAELEGMVEEVIRLDFLRHKRLNLLQDLISTIWFEQIELQVEPIELQTYTPSELVNLAEEKQKEWLSKVAQPVITLEKALFGYEEELQQLADALKSNYQRTILLVGRSGVGKTTLIWELIYQRAKYQFQQKIWETTAATLIKELSGSIGWQENLTLLCKELMGRGDWLFVRNLLELFEVGQYQGNSQSMADYLQEYLANGELALISECTEEEFARIEARSPNYLQHFQVIQLQEPKEIPVLEGIISDKVQQIAKHQSVVIAPTAIQETIRLNKRYTPYSGFPGKPIRFLESMLLNAKNIPRKGKAKATLERSHVIKAFCDETGMPPLMVDPAISMDLEVVRQFFASNVFGQTHAIDRLVDLLASVKTALLRQGKPIASMLFVGPTGVGKTEMAKVLAEFMFGSRDRMIRFDMSEFSTPHAVTRLTGEHYFSDGLLTSAVRRTPFCVLLFDELEKAHGSFNDLLLQILGEGRLTDSQGKVVNFCSAIIIMTSNIGAQRLQQGSISFQDQQDANTEAEHYLGEVRRYFRPEIFNRIDQVIPFYSLDKTVMQTVVERELNLLTKREGILHRNLEVHIRPAVYDFIAQTGYDPKYGARALQRSLQETLIIPLAKQLNQYHFDDQLVLLIDVQNEALTIEVEADPLKLELMLEELTQNEYMDYATSLRQNIMRLFEGRFYVRLLSQLDIFKRAKQKKNKQFWEDEQQSTQYTNFLALQDQFEAHKKLGEENEQQMALAIMGLAPLDTALYQQMEAWEKAYFDLKLKLYGFLQTEQEQLYLGIYGKEPLRLLEYYEAICKEKNYEWTARTVWFRDEDYNELIEATDTADPNAPKEKARAYVKQVYTPNDRQRWRPEQKDDILVGIELMITGLGASLFLNEEDGLHLLQVNDQAYKYWVACDTVDLQTPDGVHRKNFFSIRNKARRTFSATHLEDRVYKAPKRELRPSQQLPYLIKLLHKRFVTKLDALLF